MRGRSRWSFRSALALSSAGLCLAGCATFAPDTSGYKVKDAAAAIDIALAGCASSCDGAPRTGARWHARLHRDVWDVWWGYAIDDCKSIEIHVNAKEGTREPGTSACLELN